MVGNRGYCLFSNLTIGHKIGIGEHYLSFSMLGRFSRSLAANGRVCKELLLALI